MKRTLLTLTLCSLALMACTLQNVDQTPQAIAENWIRNAPTFAYDGQDLQLVNSAVRETAPPTHAFTYNFTSTHGGYGNRSGQMVTQVLTPHTIEVTVQNETVTTAVIDDRWDELRQQPIQREQLKLAYAPMQCNTTAWERAYDQGNLTFTQEPSDEELIQAYYSNQDISLQVEKRQRDGAVCQACYTCPRSYTYTITAKPADKRSLVQDGWKVTGRQTSQNTRADTIT